MRLKLFLSFLCLLFFCGGDLATKDDLIKQEKELQTIREELKKIKEDLLERQVNLSEEILSLKNKIDGMTGNISTEEYRSTQQGKRLNLLEESLLALRKKESENITSINENLANLQKGLLELKEGIEKLSSAQRELSLSHNEEKEEIEKKLQILLEEVTKENNKLRKRIAKLEKEIYSVGVYHTVKEGETLSLIAQRYKIPLKEIIKANKIEDPTMLAIGQRLFIPKK
ncbi:MAG: LysM peptidoglycan-binding domain-containing protein [Candidatus Omnitrophica bacterium]|nr:LysM peptidoglycan-binding domain-containing protein [Candidatus Omnitrophota bacterium]